MAWSRPAHSLVSSAHPACPGGTPLHGPRERGCQRSGRCWGLGPGGTPWWRPAPSLGTLFLVVWVGAFYSKQTVGVEPLQSRSAMHCPLYRPRSPWCQQGCQQGKPLCPQSAGTTVGGEQATDSPVGRGCSGALPSGRATPDHGGSDLVLDAGPQRSATVWLGSDTPGLQRAQQGGSHCTPTLQVENLSLREVRLNPPKVTESGLDFQPTS